MIQYVIMFLVCTLECHPFDHLPHSFLIIFKSQINTTIQCLRFLLSDSLKRKYVSKIIITIATGSTKRVEKLRLCSQRRLVINLLISILYHMPGSNYSEFLLPFSFESTSSTHSRKTSFPKRSYHLLSAF